MKKPLITLTVMLAAAALIVVFCSPAMAKVAGVCGNCHTMHNSQDGTHMMINTTIDGTSGGTHGGGYPALTRGSCVGCHTGDPDSGTTPYVNTAGEPGNYLAGGNFWYVTQDSANGHNVKGVPNMIADATLSVAPGDTNSCDAASCHATLFAPSASTIGGDAVLDTGCQGCHVAPKHHAPQQAAGAPALQANGYFRFLSSHINSTNGVHGIEDDNWQYTVDATDHNEYLGNASSDDHTMTG